MATKPDKAALLSPSIQVGEAKLWFANMVDYYEEVITEADANAIITTEQAELATTKAQLASGKADEAAASANAAATTTLFKMMIFS